MRVVGSLLALAIAIPALATAQDLPLGLGVASPMALSADHPLYLYSSPDAPTPLDSLTVREGPHHVELATAPPWLDLEAVKLDYDLLSFRVVSLQRHRTEVIVHNRDIRWPPKTMWLDRDAVGFTPWAAYWLEIHSIETPEAAPIVASPTDAGEPVAWTEAGRPLHVLEVQHGWARVALADATEAETGPLGWIRWHDGQRLLIRYSILS
ncbi:MAG: hypothetical protein Rubg2KO_17500 [Rubricoccaceae bacterium]